MALNETAAPAHEGFVPLVCVILTVGFPVGVIDIVITLDVTVDTVTHCREDVNVQLTNCPLVSDVVEKDELLLPVFTPFTDH